MPHRLEAAPSGRAKCRACQRAIAKGDLRFAEVVPNPVAEGLTNHFYHPTCAAQRRPEAFLQLLAPPEPETPEPETSEPETPQAGAPGPGPPSGPPGSAAPSHGERSVSPRPASSPESGGGAGAATSAERLPPEILALFEQARLAVEHRRLPRLGVITLAPSGRARCRHCGEVMAKGDLRMAVQPIDEGRLQAWGFLHLGCVVAYAGVQPGAERALRYSKLDPEQTARVREVLAASRVDSPPPKPPSPEV